jgi:hypothetical protein
MEIGMRVDAIGMLVVGGGSDALMGGGSVVPPDTFEVTVGSPVILMLFELSGAAPALGMRCATFESAEQARPRKHRNNSGAYDIDIDRIRSSMIA